MANEYHEAYMARVKAGAAKPPAPKGSARITFDSPNVVDDTKPPSVPPKPEQPVLPTDDPLRRLRVEQA